MSQMRSHMWWGLCEASATSRCGRMQLVSAGCAAVLRRGRMRGGTSQARDMRCRFWAVSQVFRVVSLSIPTFVGGFHGLNRGAGDKSPRSDYSPRAIRTISTCKTAHKRNVPSSAENIGMLKRAVVCRLSRSLDAPDAMRLLPE